MLCGTLNAPRNGLIRTLLLVRHRAGSDARTRIDKEVDLQPSFDRDQIPGLSCIRQIRCEIAVSGIERIGTGVVRRKNRPTETDIERSGERASRVERECARRSYRCV